MAGAWRFGWCLFLCLWWCRWCDGGGLWALRDGLMATRLGSEAVVMCVGLCSFASPPYGLAVLGKWHIGGMVEK